MLCYLTECYLCLQLLNSVYFVLFCLQFNFLEFFIDLFVKWFFMHNFVQSFFTCCPLFLFQFQLLDLIFFLLSQFFLLPFFFGPFFYFFIFCHLFSFFIQLFFVFSVSFLFLHQHLSFHNPHFSDQFFSFELFVIHYRRRPRFGS